MTKRSLPTVGGQPQGLGETTIMSRELAARYGVTYVHMAVFAIDVDRVHEIADDEDDAWPYGWEVFVTECYLLEHLQPTDEKQRAMLEETCLAILDLPPSEIALGSQLPFAIYDAVQRGAWPGDLGAMFRPWRRRAELLVKRMRPHWEKRAEYQTALAQACLDAPLDVPLAPPTVEALQRLMRTA